MMTGTFTSGVLTILQTILAISTPGLSLAFFGFERIRKKVDRKHCRW